VRATYDALAKHSESAALSYDGERAKALEFLQYWIDEPPTIT